MKAKLPKSFSLVLNGKIKRGDILRDPTYDATYEFAVKDGAIGDPVNVNYWLTYRSLDPIYAVISKIADESGEYVLNAADLRALRALDE